jgi:peptidoglycan/LPS O-acetylase OafA/YrhL
MKYGESTFDILYLLFAITTGIIILAKRKDSIGKLMGTAALVLGCGDAFHLVPRVLNYFVDKDFTAWLGFGKLVTSVTMTIFYLLVFFLHTKLYKWSNEKEKNAVMISLFVLTCCRIMICCAPGNGWLTGDGTMFWGILRNIPFVAIGVLIVILYFQRRKENKNFSRLWIYVTLSFLFYLPVATVVSIWPMLGMLMLPKTVCYMLVLGIFLKETFKPASEQA